MPTTVGAAPCYGDRLPVEKLFITAQDLVDMGYLTSTSTAPRAVERGELPPATRVGQRHVWRRDEVLEFIDSRKGVTHFANGLSSSRRRKVVVVKS